MPQKVIRMMTHQGGYVWAVVVLLRDERPAKVSQSAKIKMGSKDIAIGVAGVGVQNCNIIQECHVQHINRWYAHRTSGVNRMLQKLVGLLIQCHSLRLLEVFQRFWLS